MFPGTSRRAPHEEEVCATSSQSVLVAEAEAASRVASGSVAFSQDIPGGYTRTQYPAGFRIRECARLSCLLDDIGRLSTPTALRDPGHGRSERRNSRDRPCLAMHPAPRARCAKLGGSPASSASSARLPRSCAGGSGLQPQLWPCSASMKAPTEWPGKLREERRASSSSYGKGEARDPPGTVLRVHHSDEGPCART